jgi:hypothetical protein
VLVDWKDNIAVYVASNVHRADMDKRTAAATAEEKKEIQVCSSFLFA